MLNDKLLCEVWSRAYGGTGKDCGGWDFTSDEGKFAWAELARWLEEIPKHKRTCEYRLGTGACSC